MEEKIETSGRTNQPAFELPMLVQEVFDRLAATKARSPCLSALIDQFTFAKACHWLRICKEQSAVEDDDCIRIAKEALAMGPLDSVGASQAAWARLQGAKSDAAPLYDANRLKGYMHSNPPRRKI
ncbi:MAG TPA: hypothetical protein VFW73_04355 [Lacipirellulaceae bacterium]|nr:hypothetical protein [Lacipirellulaceae bacterium]